MTPSLILKYTIIAIMAYHLAIPFISFHEMKNAPEMLLAFEASKSAEQSSLRNVVTYIVLLFIAINFISCIGALLKKNWSRWLFLWSVIVPHLLLLFYGYIVIGPLSGLFDSISMILSGFAIGLLYYSSAFESKSVNSA